MIKLNRFHFLKTLGLSLGGIAANEATSQITGVNPLQELILRLQNPHHSQFTYKKVLPENLIGKIEESIGRYGFADLLENPQLYQLRDKGLYFTRPANSLNYDCFKSSTRIFNLLSQYSDEIEGYLGHRIVQGADEYSIYSQHYWVELLLRNGWTAESVKIDLTPPYKDSNPLHKGTNLVGINLNDEIRLDDLMIASSCWEDKMSGLMFLSAIGIKSVGERPFINYAVDIVPIDKSEVTLRYELLLDTATPDILAFEIRKENDKKVFHGEKAGPYRQVKIDPNTVLNMMHPTDRSALLAMRSNYNNNLLTFDKSNVFNK